MSVFSRSGIKKAPKLKALKDNINFENVDVFDAGIAWLYWLITEVWFSDEQPGSVKAGPSASTKDEFSVEYQDEVCFCLESQQATLTSRKWTLWDNLMCHKKPDCYDRLVSTVTFPIHLNCFSASCVDCDFLCISHIQRFFWAHNSIFCSNPAQSETEQSILKKHANEWFLNRLKQN